MRILPLWVQSMLPQNPIQRISHELKHIVENKNVALLGSAPNNKGIPGNCSLIASVNASHIGFNIQHVNILFLNSWSLVDKIEIQKRVKVALASVTCDILVYIDAAGSGIIPPVQCKKLVCIHKNERSRVLSWASGRSYERNAAGNHVPSTGVTAKLILERLGAKTHLSGFSLCPGHILMEDSERGHLTQDCEYLGIHKD